MSLSQTESNMKYLHASLACLHPRNEFYHIFLISLYRMLVPQYKLHVVFVFLKHKYLSHTIADSIPLLTLILFTKVLIIKACLKSNTIFL